MVGALERKIGNVASIDEVSSKGDYKKEDNTK